MIHDCLGLKNRPSSLFDPVWFVDAQFMIVRSGRRIMD